MYVQDQERWSVCCRRSGRAPWGALVSVGLVLVLFVFGRWWLGLGGPTHGPERAATPTSEQAPAGAHVHRDEAEPASVRIDIAPRDPGPRPRPALVPDTPEELAARFDGTGRIEGYVDLPAGVPMPRNWTLVLEPSKVLIGGDRAAPRRVEFSAAETSFSVDDLPLGGYEVRAEAPGMSGATEYQLLARPDSQYVILRLDLRPAAFVEGRVLDAEGAGVEGLTLFLVQRSNGTRREVTTGPGGGYLFELVPDGEHTLYPGHVESPLAPARELVVSPPSVPMPDFVVPVLARIEVRVRDRAGQFVEGARIEGWGSNGGRVDGTTDRMGLYEARFLPAGRFTVSAYAPPPAADLRARGWIDVEPGGSQALDLELSPGG